MTRHELADSQVRFDALYEEHAHAVYAYARRRLGPHDAEEIVCDVYVTAWRRLDDIASSERAWLIGVARRMIANHLRAARRRAAVDERAVQIAPANEPDHADGVAARSQVAWVIDQLSAKDREIMHLVCEEGLTTPEVGVVLGCSTNAASVRVRRARERFATFYERAERDPVTVQHSALCRG